MSALRTWHRPCSCNNNIALTPIPGSGGSYISSIGQPTCAAGTLRPKYLRKTGRDPFLSDKLAAL